MGSSSQGRCVAEARVAVLLGGTSAEREISLLSGDTVQTALSENDGRGPAAVERVEIDAQGGFVFASDAPVSLARGLERLGDYDVCFLALHGGDGEDGHVQAALELAGIPFTGSGTRASVLAMDKCTSRVLTQVAGLTVAEARSFARQTWNDGEDLPGLLADCPEGVCVKPRGGGSSVDTQHARDLDHASSATLALLEQGEEVLVERWISGTEVTCAVLGNRVGALRALPPVEIRPKNGRFFDYEEKYSEGGASELCPPESVSAERCATIEEHALAAHRVLGCDGYSRSDFILPDNGPPVYLETNSLPGLTPRSLVPLAASQAGLDFRSLCLRILELGLAREGSR